MPFARLFFFFAILPLICGACPKSTGIPTVNGHRYSPQPNGLRSTDGNPRMMHSPAERHARFASVRQSRESNERERQRIHEKEIAQMECAAEVQKELAKTNRARCREMFKHERQSALDRSKTILSLQKDANNAEEIRENTILQHRRFQRQSDQDDNRHAEQMQHESTMRNIYDTMRECHNDQQMTRRRQYNMWMHELRRVHDLQHTNQMMQNVWDNIHTADQADIELQRLRALNRGALPRLAEQEDWFASDHISDSHVAARSPSWDHR